MLTNPCSMNHQPQRLQYRHQYYYHMINTNHKNTLKNYDDYLCGQNDISMFHIKTGAHFDHRIGCCNFSVIGRNCKLYERKEYVKYDNINKERERIAREFEEKFPNIEAVIGGETGLDIFPRGKNKGQIMEDLDWHSVHFFGDKMEEGGNDAPLGNRIDNRPFGYTYAVKDWKHTWEILEGFTYT